MLLLALCAISTQLLIEFLGTTKFLWPHRKVLLFLHMPLIGVSTGLVVTSLASWWVILVFIIQIYRSFNLLRLSQNRLNESHLKNVARRSSLILGGFLLAAILFSLLELEGKIYLDFALSAILVSMAARAAILLFTLKKRLRISTIKNPKPLADNELPTLTVAIPARNETVELTGCLESLLNSDYSKLEILVLDDCSQDNTSEIIKGFSHRGVRFLKGTPPPASWLAKNWAYNQLLSQANAEIILFCGVDVRFERQSLKQIIGQFKTRNIKMSSVLPARPASGIMHMVWQPMRYWRELALPSRERHGYPPALSTIWLADVDTLKSIGSFDAIKKAVRPEHIFARALDRNGEYSFMLNGKNLNISSIKTMDAQLQTAIRTRYLELRRQVEFVLSSSIITFALFVLPFIALPYSIFTGKWLVTLLCIVTISLVFYMQAKILAVSNGKANIISILSMPVVAVCEIAVINYSMWAYEFSDVVWKGRNICLPALRVTPRLPNIT